jgi:long-chain acyl-CoA synthetase
VFPEEVETALGSAECLKELCVAARKCDDGFKEGTEEVCAVVVPADALLGQFKNQPDMVMQTVKKQLDELALNLAPYKRPTRIFIYDGELPKTATRKVKRPLVMEWLAMNQKQG